jgi:phage terminase large subunit-like protein
VFKAARDMAEASPGIRKRLGKGIKRNYLEHPTTFSIFRALSSDGMRQHGLNVHGAVIDEVHVHRSPDLIDALETGTGSREQPLVLFITTADDGTDGTVYATKREYLEGVVSGSIKDSTFYGVVFGVDHEVEGFDPFSDATLAAANPGAGYTVTWEYLRAKANEARQSPAQLNRYLRLHLNVRTRQTVRWLDMAAWDAAGGADPTEEFAGRPAWAGLDLSATTDFTAAAIIARGDVPTSWLVDVLVWVPEERLEVLEHQTSVPLRRWAAEGRLNLTEGSVVDYERVREDLKAEIARLGCTVTEVAYDPWNATETVQRLEEDGFLMVPIRQGYASLTSPCKELERAVYGSTPAAPLFRHGGHPVLRWMADCVEVRQDDNGNLKPSKPDRRKSAKRIDGIAACVNALARGITHEEELTSAYETGGLVVV